MSKLINLTHIFVVVPLFIILGLGCWKNSFPMIHQISNSPLMGVLLLLLAVGVLLIHTIKIYGKSQDSFMMRDGLRLLSDQYIGESASIQDNKVDYFMDSNGNDDENFIAQNLPLWTEK